MSTTALDLITAAFLEINEIEPGETPEPTYELPQALAKLNRIVGSINNEGQKMLGLLTETQTLTSGIAAYTMGTAGTFGSTRPQKIVSAAVTQVNGLRSPLKVVDAQEWNQQDTAASSPDLKCLFCDYEFPVATVKVAPKPSVTSLTLEIVHWQKITQFAALNTVVSLPDGYERFLITALALELAPEYGAVVSPALAANASEAAGRISALNASNIPIAGTPQPPAPPAGVSQQGQ